MDNNIEQEKIIEVRNVRKTYHMGMERIKAVDNVSFTINKGEFCCLLGTSGSGKSTLLNLMAGIERLSGGEILIKGQPVHQMNENKLAKFRQDYLGFVFQSYNLMNSMTALENVEFPLVFKRIPVKKRRKMARDMLIKVGLKTRLAHKPKEMSGGQQQRVGIARAFVAKPEIVFADEPTGNLDSHTTREVMELIKGIAIDNRQTIVMVTHDRKLSEYADKIIHIMDGKIESIEINEHPRMPGDECDELTTTEASEGTAIDSKVNVGVTVDSKADATTVDSGKDVSASKISDTGNENKESKKKPVDKKSTENRAETVMQNGGSNEK